MRMREEMHVLTGSYAVDALSEPERRAFERHLRRCGSCPAEVRGLRETAAELARATAWRPPDRMRERVLAAAYRTRQLPPPARERGPASARSPLGAAAAAGPGSAGPGACVPAARRRHGRQPGRGHRPRRRRGRDRHQLEQARAGNAAIAQVLAAPGARIETTRTSVGGTITVVVSRAYREAVISAAGMPALPAAGVYQLWVMDPAGARPAGLLPGARPAGPVLASGVVPGDRIGVTVEPAGGASRPTTTPIAVLPA